MPVHDIMIPVAFGLGLQASEVRAGGRFAEELAPGLLAVEDRWDVAVDLFLGAVGGDRRCRQHEPETRWGSKNVFGRHETHRSSLLRLAPALAIGVLGERGLGVSSVRENLPPFAHRQARVPVRVKPVGEFLHWISHVPRLLAEP